MKPQKEIRARADARAIKKLIADRDRWKKLAHETGDWAMRLQQRESWTLSVGFEQNERLTAQVAEARWLIKRLTEGRHNATEETQSRLSAWLAATEPNQQDTLSQQVAFLRAKADVLAATKP